MFFGGVMGVRGGNGVGMGKGSVLDPIKPVLRFHVKRWGLCVLELRTKDKI